MNLKTALALLFLSPAAAPAAQWFPESGELFQKLIADPRAVQTKVSYYRLDGYDEADVALGKSWGIYRWRAGSWDWQSDVEGMAYGRFRIGGGINRFEVVDYFANLPVEFRKGNFSGQFTLYHESSHLGDDYIRQNGAPQAASTSLPGARFSMEAAKAIFSEDFLGRTLRLYGGDVQILHTIRPLGRQFIEWGGLAKTHVLWRAGGLAISGYASWDLQSREYIHWNINSYSVAGIKIVSEKTGHSVRVQGGYFDGHSPYGQLLFLREHYADMAFLFDF